MWFKIAQILIQLLAGIGTGAVLDKVAADKLPAYPSDGVTPFKEGSGLNWKKIAWFVGITILSGIVLKWVGKKMNIKLLK